MAFNGVQFDPPAPLEPIKDGLGLAIEKTCVEECGGEVSARNLEPKGFEIRFNLKPGS